MNLRRSGVKLIEGGTFIAQITSITCHCTLSGRLEWTPEQCGKVHGSYTWECSYTNELSSCYSVTLYTCVYLWTLHSYIRTYIHTFIHTPTHACTICTQSSVITCVVSVHVTEEDCTEYCVPLYYSLNYADTRHYMEPDMSIYILCTVSVYVPLS